VSIQRLYDFNNLSINGVFLSSIFQYNISQVTVLRNFQLIVATELGFSLILRSELDLGEGARGDIVCDVMGEALGLTLGSRQRTHERRLDLRVNDNVHFETFKLKVKLN
jgi:hypothetical protein